MKRFKLTIPKRKKRIAQVMLLIMLFEICAPLHSFALTGGPAQPEFQSFTPIGSNDMVDLFTGNFGYNIPLMEIDGYPITLGYANVDNADQESSWVGLGWNINLGEVNRVVRGLPDDLKNETIERRVHLKNQVDGRVDLGINLEVFGFKMKKLKKLMGKLSKKAKRSGGINFYYGRNNYYGQYGGIGVGAGASMNMGRHGLSAGLNMDFSSNKGGNIGVSGGYAYSKVNEKKLMQRMGLNYSRGFNTRQGYSSPVISGNYTISDLKDKNSVNGIAEEKGYRDGDCRDMDFNRTSGFSTGGPIIPGLLNYVPTMSNQTNIDAYSLGFSVPGIKIAAGIYGTIGVTYSHSTTMLQENGDRQAYGYLYHGYSDKNSLLDYQRDNAGIFNKNIPNLPMASTTYDIYNVNAHGAGGSFRPFRNDFGVLHDPAVLERNNTDNFGIAAELGFGTIMHLGVDFRYTNVKFESGILPGKKKKRVPNYKNFNTNIYGPSGQIFSGLKEPYFFKQQGEFTLNQAYNNRRPRSNMFYFYDANMASNNDVSYAKEIQNYTSQDGLVNGVATSKSPISRVGGKRKSHHISEMIQISPNGSKYVFGIPAMNNITKETSIGLGNNIAPEFQTGICKVPGIETASQGKSGSRDEFYTYTKTPAHAHSYLLSSILSSDYIDITNDGVSDDDLGNFIKFNYNLADDDYRWRMPYSDGEEHAFFEAGFNVESKDNRASYTAGSKELWYAHSIESKNSVVEFYTSPKSDGKGVKEGISNTNYSSALSDKGSTYKLDSIKLYGKNDRFINGTDAVPIKTVYFAYDYELCPNTPNSVATNGGKLTLKKVYTKFGNSRKSLLSPYQFEYSDFNPDYNPATKNNWGTYSPIQPKRPNYLFPYVDQFLTDADANMYASAWQLDKVKLPSGGEIKVSYESDDYAFVQNKRAAEMTQIVGVGSQKNFSTKGSRLYTDKDNINEYLFVKKRGGNYFSSNLKKVFLDNENLIYFNVATDIVNRNYDNRDNYDQVKGFAEVSDIGICPDNNDYLYIKLKPKKLEKGKMTLNPITYAGINIGRKDLSHLLYPGGDNPNGSEMFKAIWGSLKSLINSLLMINPVKTMVKIGKAKNIDVDRSFVRLSSPNLKKKGGGCRVRRIELNDNWDKLLGGEPNSTFGNEYDYTIEYEGEKISSGVASYEPFIGGDENALKGINKFKIQQGSTFPRNEPMHDLQLTPVGEAFYPVPIVGYSSVVTISIHEPYAHSAQTALKTEFYTARDFPVQMAGVNTLAPKSNHTPALLAIFSPVKSNSWYGSQKYQMILNDMHGKLKKITNYAKRSPIPSAGKEQISSIEYKYATSSPGKLNNLVETMNFNPSTGQMEYGQKELGVETEKNTDSRWSRQRTWTIGVELNLDWEVPPFILIPSFWPILSWDITKFGSLVESKVVQQHGILEETIVVTNGATNIMRNEVFNPETGQVIVKSYNNEFKDRIYETTYPASWAYKGTSATYKNLFYKSTFSSFEIDTCKNAILFFTSEQRKALCQGDEILIKGPTTEKFWIGEMRDTTYWVTPPGGAEYQVSKCYAKAYPRDPQSLSWSTGTHTNKSFQVVRSGRKNQLNLSIQSSASNSNPNGGPGSTLTPGGLISLNTTTYDWKNVIGYNKDCSTNPFLKGQMGNLRPSNSYVYYKDRDYATGHSRYDGLFNISGADEFWTIQSLLCETKLAPNTNTMVWKPSTNQIWYSPWGMEVQNKNPLLITSSAQFGYNRILPISICSNTEHNTFAFDGFEDYKTLIPSNSLNSNALDYNLSPFKGSSNFSLNPPMVPIPANVAGYYNYSSTGGLSIDNADSHTGEYSLKTNSALALNLDVAGTNIHHNRLQLKPNTKYIMSLWVKGSVGNNLNVLVGTNQTVFKKKTSAIDGWVKYECVFNTASSAQITLNFPTSINIDDFRVFPNKSNMKSFVYDHVSNRLNASMDENNFASFFEYDAEGTLIRTKKETNKGIVTLNETRSSMKK